MQAALADELRLEMITSTSNPRVQWVRTLQKKRRARKSESLFVIEGTRLANEAVSSRAPAKLVLYTDALEQGDHCLIEELINLGAEAEEVSERVMKACSDTESPQGLLAVLPIPFSAPPDNLNLALVADRISDPGNLGTILRTALAAGVEAVFLSAGTVDPFNPKVVRGAMGAHFHLPIIQEQTSEIEKYLRGIDVWVAEAGLGSPYYDVDWNKPSAIVIGSEAHGPSDELRSIAKGSTHIPIQDLAESLNASVAAAVILFEIARMRGKE
ncbi:MAG: RNA methyltransferase [Anaerolineales bacterium]|nr:MAG: RNA methyltransferase [Anaerolineales bacterium]